MKSLYVHIPFCNNICNYCDFVKRVSNEENKNKYIEAVLKEVEFYTKKMNNIETIYIGGGTPTSLSVSQLETVLDAITKAVDMNKIVEFSIETNVETLTASKIDLLIKYGVNRVSIGVQTFSDKLLNVIGRKHEEEDVFQLINLLKLKGLDNINIDLIYAIPGETLHDVEKDLELFLQLDIPHVSYYSLILEEKTKFYNDYLKDRLELVSNDLEASMYEQIINTLKEKGYAHYEISNFAKPGYESKHNKTYWKNEEYIGIGLGAHGHMDGVRYANNPDLMSFLDRYYLEDETILTKEEQMSEQLILGLRLLEGVSLEKFKEKYNVEMMDVYPHVQKLIDEDLLVLENGHIKLSKKGLFRGNDIFESFLVD